jgi:hypothetical protein
MAGAWHGKASRSCLFRLSKITVQQFELDKTGNKAPFVWVPHALPFIDKRSSLSPDGCVGTRISLITPPDDGIARPRWSDMLIQPTPKTGLDVVDETAKSTHPCRTPAFGGVQDYDQVVSYKVRGTLLARFWIAAGKYRGKIRSEGYADLRERPFLAMPTKQMPFGSRTQEADESSMGQ